MESFKRDIVKQILEICGEEDRFRGDMIEIAPLQISKQARNVKELDQTGHFHYRKDVVNIFSDNFFDIVKHEVIFEEAMKHAMISASRCCTKEAKSKHVLRYGNLVFIGGQAGIGKTTLSKVLVQQMLSPELHLYQADLVFFIRFRDLDYQNDLDLLQFLTTSAPFISNLEAEDKEKIIQHLEASDNVYIVMDGLDEATLDLKAKCPRCNFTSSVQASTFIQNLLSGRLLPLSKKIVTSRPRKLAQLPDEYSSNLYLNLLGISNRGQWQICRDICGDDVDRRERIFQHINSRPDLKSLCYVPITCIMVMISFFSLTSLENNAMSTLTAILVTALEEWFLKKLEGRFQTKEISFLAFEGFLCDRFYFREIHLKTAKVNFENTSAFLTNNIKFKLLQGKAITYFAHLMWQEFFVAIKLRLYTNKEKFRSILSELESDKFEVVMKFLFGLCNNNTLNQLLDCVDIDDLNTDADRKECQEMLKQIVMKTLQTNRDAENIDYLDSILPISGWLREMGDNDFTKQAADCLRNEIMFEKTQIICSDIPNIAHLLQARGSKLAIIVDDPTFVGNCTQYFFKELHGTMNQNVNIQVN